MNEYSLTIGFNQKYFFCQKARKKLLLSFLNLASNFFETGEIWNREKFAKAIHTPNLVNILTNAL